jgi:hypothetical protein
MLTLPVSGILEICFCDHLITDRNLVFNLSDEEKNLGFHVFLHGLIYRDEIEIFLLPCI